MQTINKPTKIFNQVLDFKKSNINPKIKTRKII